MKVHELVARCAKAGESADPMSSVREVLEDLRGDVEAVEQHRHAGRAVEHLARIATHTRDVTESVRTGALNPAYTLEPRVRHAAA